MHVTGLFDRLTLRESRTGELVFLVVNYVTGMSSRPFLGALVMRQPIGDDIEERRFSAGESAEPVGGRRACGVVLLRRVILALRWRAASEAMGEARLTIALQTT